ncbi:MAG TPA: hypothetical protein VF777_05950 [Phycisphaerales bacterium]
MNTRPAFTLLDLIACIGLAAVVSAVGVPAVRTATSDNALQRCRYNLRGLAQGSAMYTEDFGGRMWAMSWREGMIDPVGQFAYPDDMSAQGFQTGYAIRRVRNLQASKTPIPPGWTPTLLYSHIALLDYIGAKMPTTPFVCPLDTRRAKWVAGDYSDLPGAFGDGGETGNWRLPATMTYIATVYQWMPDRQVSYINRFGRIVKSPTAFPSSSNILSWQYDPGNGPADTGWWGPKLASSVRYPSQKVFMFDEFARHNGAQRYYAYPTAAQDLMFYDGSVRFYRTDATNPGWRPSSATDRGNMLLRFSFTRFADAWGGLDNNKPSDTLAAGWYRWTRGGLLGWDVPRLSSMVGKPPSTSVVENELDTGPATGSW